MVKKYSYKEVADKHFNGDVGQFCYMDDVTNAINKEREEAQLEFVELLNHNKRKIFKGEDRDVNEIFLDLDFLRSLVITSYNNDYTKEDKESGK